MSLVRLHRNYALYAKYSNVVAMPMIILSSGTCSKAAKQCYSRAL